MSTLLDASILKTLRFNLHYFGIKGFRLPVLVGKNVMSKNLRGGVKIESYKTANVRIGFDGIGICDPKYQKRYLACEWDSLLWRERSDRSRCKAELCGGCDASNRKKFQHKC